jgi:isopentenyl phosphate kinase
MGAEKIIEVSDVEGIFTANPKINKNARLIPEINRKNYQDIQKCLSGSTAADVTGGMKQKYLELLDAAKTGIICQIVDLKHFKDALEGKPAGTVINLQQ